MTTTRHFPVRFLSATAALVGLTLVVTGCSSSDKTATPATTNPTAAAPAGNDGEFCKTVRKWTVHDFDGTGDEFVSDPAAFKKYWTDYMNFVSTATKQSPAELRNDWQVGYDWLGKEFTPILEKYDYDVAHAQEEATPAELAVGKRFQEGGNPEEQGAQEAVHAYEGRVCQSAQPPAAEVTFEGVEPNQAYCDAVKAGDELAGEVVAKKWSIPAVKSFVNSDEFTESLDKAKKNAPAEIKADVLADVDWQANQQVDVLEKYGYDARKLLLEGSAADRAIFQRSDPTIADHYARTVAYEQQVCGL